MEMFNKFNNPRIKFLFFVLQVLIIRSISLIRRKAKVSFDLNRRRNKYDISESGRNLDAAENFGIKIIYEDSNVILIRKSGNVALNPAEDKSLYRRAAPCVELWADGYLKRYQSNSLRMISTMNHPSFSGVVLLLKSLSALKLLDYVNNGAVQYRYSAVVQQGNIDPIEVSRNLGHRVEVQQSSCSGSYADGLSIISVFVCSSNKDLRISHVVDLLSTIGLPCHREGSVPYISLMELIVDDDNDVIEEATLFKSSQSLSHPKKFLKFLRREKLLYERRFQQLSATTACDLASSVFVSSPHIRQEDVISGSESAGRSDLSRSPSGGVTCSFRGLCLAVPLQGLRPRESSGIIVDAALRIIRSEFSVGRREALQGSHKKGVRVLDIGCGSGALLLSIIHESSRNSTGDSSDSHLSRVSGCGIDVDALALKHAEENYREIFKERGENQEQDVARARWHNVDFTKLPSEHHRLSSSTDSDTWWGDFDVIVCNPPFLSQKAGSGRATEEGAGVLVGGKSGLEAYESICKGIVQCEGSQSAASVRPLLSPTGWIVFQTPGGDRGRQRVAQVVEKLGFEVFEDSAFMNRRCLVIRRRRFAAGNHFASV